MKKDKERKRKISLLEMVVILIIVSVLFRFIYQIHHIITNWEEVKIEANNMSEWQWILGIVFLVWYTGTWNKITKNKS